MDWQQLAADFHWLLQSPPLLQIPSQWQLPPALIQQAPELWSAVYQQAPALAKRVDAKTYRRLGHYYEALWQTLLQHHARYQLIVITSYSIHYTKLYESCNLSSGLTPNQALKAVVSAPTPK